MKGHRISDEDKDRAVEFYEAGKSYEEIEQLTGISRAALSGIIEERSNEDPDLQSTHALSKWLKDNKKTPETLLRTTVFEDMVDAAGFTMDDVVDVVLPFVKKYGKKAPEIARNGEAYAKIVGPTGWTYPQLVTEQGKAIEEFERQTKATQALKEEEASMVEKVGKLTATLGHLEDLGRVDASLKRIRRRPGDAAAMLEKSEELWKKGVTTETLDKLGTEFQKRGLNGADAPAEIAEFVRKYGTLKTAVASKTQELTVAQRELSRVNRRLPLLSEKEKQRKAACVQVGTRLANLQRQYDSLKESFTEREKNLEESHRQREATRASSLAKMEADTEARCSGMISEANKAVQKREKDGAEEFERKREGWSGRLSAMQERHDQLSADNDQLDAETREKQNRIVTSEALWGFAMEKQPLYFGQVRRLYGSGGAYAGMPLPEPMRAVMVGAVKSLALTDAMVRLDLAEKKRLETEKSSRETLSKAYTIYCASENTMSQFARIRQGLTSYEDVR